MTALAAAQAREHALREALDECKNMIGATLAWFGHEFTDTVREDVRYLEADLRMMEHEIAALSAPADTGALRVMIERAVRDFAKQRMLNIAESGPREVADRLLGEHGA